MSNQKYGAGIWHFASCLDRYATDGYGPPRSLLETIDLAGRCAIFRRGHQLPVG